MSCGCQSKRDFSHQPRPMVIKEVKSENDMTKSFVFETPFSECEPGQFIMAWLPGVEEAPFCIANDDPFMLTIAAVGPLTNKIHTLKAGDKLWVRGPFGQGFVADSAVKKPVLVGGGYGSAPMAYLGRCFLEEGCAPVAVLGGRTATSVLAADRFEALNIPLHITTDDGSLGEEGRVTAPVERLLKEGKCDAIYAVGPNGMLAALEDLAKKYNVPAHLSWEEKMGCGMGICGMCEHTDGRLLCLEGPVLSS